MVGSVHYLAEKLKELDNFNKHYLLLDYEVPLMKEMTKIEMMEVNGGYLGLAVALCAIGFYGIVTWQIIKKLKAMGLIK